MDNFRPKEILWSKVVWWVLVQFGHFFGEQRPPEGEVVATVMVKAKYGVAYGIFDDSSLNQALSKGERSKLGSVMVEVTDSSSDEDKG